MIFFSQTNSHTKKGYGAIVRGNGKADFDFFLRNCRTIMKTTTRVRKMKL